jgi:diaminohydroxyphosphoribosylaminopyrimidine deaminase/5-amino-6-(5-phosphoribosylamino)uracil reductase
MVIRTRDPAEVLKALSDRTDVLLEGGPTLAGAFLRAGVIDRILAYVAPILLGGPITAVDDVGVPSIARALRWRYDGVERVGPDLLLSLVPREPATGSVRGDRPSRESATAPGDDSPGTADQTRG